MANPVESLGIHLLYPPLPFSMAEPYHHPVLAYAAKVVFL